MTPQPSIEDHLHSFITDTKEVKIDFNSLALSVFGNQIERNTPYRNYCQSLSVPSSDIKRWQDIPTVTTEVFKLHDLPIISFPSDEIRHTFTTSGTTQDIKGQHHLPSLDLYQQSIVATWDQLQLPHLKSCQPIFLTPTPQQAPQSSLAHMMGVLADTAEKAPIWAVNHTNGQIDYDAIAKATQSQEPIALLGTALAFLHLFEQLKQLDHPLKLPTGSWAMETGGYKGTHRQLEKAELYTMFQDQLGLESDLIINEYSMTELSSQFYTTGLDKPHVGPPWTRIRVVDPLTETDALPGEPGHLVIYDLANLHSVMAIRTQDLAISNGDNSFTLLGRDPSALPRGCSRATDDALRS